MCSHKVLAKEGTSASDANMIYKEPQGKLASWLTFRHYLLRDVQDSSQQAVHVLHQLISNLHVALTRFRFTEASCMQTAHDAFTLLDPIQTAAAAAHEFSVELDMDCSRDVQ